MRWMIVFFGIAVVGCDSTETGTLPVEACPPVCGRSPTAAKCSDFTKVQSCPDHPCMAPVAQRGDVSMLRIGRQLPVAPASLVTITRTAINPNVNPRCFDAGRDGFNWLLRIDKKAGTLTTGGARPAADGQTYKYLDEGVDGFQLAVLCPGFVGAPLSLRPKTVPVTLTNGKYASAVIDKLNIPIYSESIPIVLPLTEVRFSDVQLSPDGTCIGSWERDYWCDPDSLGWKTSGLIEGKILVEDADKMPVKSLGCRSLCAILVDDSTKTDEATQTCKKNADGTYPEIGDTCIGGTGCKNAWQLRSSFGAYGITIQ